MPDALISYTQALELTLTRITPLGSEKVPLAGLLGRVASEALYALVDAPSADASIKDGYAVRSDDIAQASAERPVRLRVLDDLAAAGGARAGVVGPGEAIRILSGARLPPGAQAVVSEEFTRREGERLAVMADASPGRNVLRQGSDIQGGQLLISAGEELRPARVGLLAAAGHTQAAVYIRPRVAILATGDEVVAPGEELPEGKLFASNLVTLAAWCRHYGMQISTGVVRDETQTIRLRLLEAIRDNDALLTSGGAWSGDRDFVVSLLEELGWEKVYHRVRIGPGKAVGFGLLQGKPVFCLPGGPPSNYMAFLQLALPGLLRLSGHTNPGLPRMQARLAESVRGQADWTQFIGGLVEVTAQDTLFRPLRTRSRLQMMADAQAVLAIPEDQEQIPAGADVQISLLEWPDRMRMARKPGNSS